jgi:hypothetical protein
MQDLERAVRIPHDLRMNIVERRFLLDRLIWNECPRILIQSHQWLRPKLHLVLLVWNPISWPLRIKLKLLITVKRFWQIGLLECLWLIRLLLIDLGADPGQQIIALHVDILQGCKIASNHLLDITNFLGVNAGTDVAVRRIFAWIINRLWLLWTCHRFREIRKSVCLLYLGCRLQ